MDAMGVDLKSIRVKDSFWSHRIEQIAEHTIPYQWRILNDEEEGVVPSRSVKNFLIAAGLEQGEFEGKVFQDSDLAKWIEAAAYSLASSDNLDLRSILTKIISVIGRAQQPDGYLNTFYTIKEPEKRWKHISNGHELYCSGHMLEAAVALYEVLGDDTLLAIMDKNIDHIIATFGKEEGKIDSYPGHPEIEVALTRAFEVTGKQKYLDLASYFIENRGSLPGFTNEPEFVERLASKDYVDLGYYQAQAPIRQQLDADGHSVRVMYYLAGAADVARYLSDASLIEALQRLWESVTKRRMYITGGIGSQGEGERFTLDYDLPNDRAYAETCASVGLMMFAYRMLKIKPDRQYSDVLERVLYNGMLSGVSFDGKTYFYVNPLQMNPEVAEKRYDMRQIDTQRVPWFGCACCPPNAIRTIASIGRYIYTRRGDGIYLHLHIGNQTEFVVSGSKKLLCEVTSEMPWRGETKIVFAGEGSCRIYIRVPSYAESFSCSYNGKNLEYQLVNGYLSFNFDSIPGDCIEVSFPFVPQFMKANIQVLEDIHKVAIVRGPFVYCAEAADNDYPIHTFRVDTSQAISEGPVGLFDGIYGLSVQGTRVTDNEYDKKSLYYTLPDKETLYPATLNLIPYPYWNNRGKGAMQVWITKQ